MNKFKKLAPFFIIAIVLVILPQPALAKKSGLTADNPFYFLDTFVDEVNLFISITPESKAKKAAKIKEERKAEAKELEAKRVEIKKQKEALNKKLQESSLTREEERTINRLNKEEEKLTELQEKTQNRINSTDEVLSDEIAKVSKESQEQLTEEIELIEEEGEKSRLEEQIERESNNIEDEPLAEEFTPELVVEELSEDEDIESEEIIEQGNETTEVEIIPKRDPFEDFPLAGNVEPAIANITYSDFKFIQTDETEQPFKAGGVFIKGEKDLVVRFDYDEEFSSLKTIGVSLRYPNDEDKIFAFILKHKPELSQYIARTTALGETGNYPLNIYLINYNDEIMQKISGELVVAGDINFGPFGMQVISKVKESLPTKLFSLFSGF